MKRITLFVVDDSKETNQEEIDWIQNKIDRKNIILLDLVVLEKNEKELIQYMQEKNKNQKDIVITTYHSIQKISKLGWINQEKELNILITRTLHELGVPSHMKGYQYMKEGIAIIIQQPSRMKELYPMIAEKYHSTTSRVERAIRHAIEISWNRANWDYMEELFGYSIDMDKAKPTNREYMITIAEKLRMEYNNPLLST